VFDVQRTLLELDEFPKHLPVLVRTQDGRRVCFTIEITDIRREDEHVVIVGDLNELEE
jgi:hypothetical protein